MVLRILPSGSCWVAESQHGRSLLCCHSSSSDTRLIMAFRSNLSVRTSFFFFFPPFFLKTSSVNDLGFASWVCHLWLTSTRRWHYAFNNTMCWAQSEQGIRVAVETAGEERTLLRCVHNAEDLQQADCCKHLGTKWAACQQGLWVIHKVKLSFWLD